LNRRETLVGHPSHKTVAPPGALSGLTGVGCGGEGMFLEVLNELFEGGKGGFAHVVFDAFNIGVEAPGIESDEAEKLAEECVADLDGIRYGFPGLGEDKTAVGLAPEVAEIGQPFDHDGNARADEIQLVGNIGDGGVAVAFDEIGNAFEIILGTFGEPFAVVSTELLPSAGGRLPGRLEACGGGSGGGGGGGFAGDAGAFARHRGFRGGISHMP